MSWSSTAASTLNQNAIWCDAELKRRGFRVLRFWNDDVLKDLDGVCDTIIAFVRDQGLQPWR